MRTLLAFLTALLRSTFISRRDLALENAALRQQLAAYQRGKKCPRLKPSERVLWAVLSRFWSKWKHIVATSILLALRTTHDARS